MVHSPHLWIQGFSGGKDGRNGSSRIETGQITPGERSPALRVLPALLFSLHAVLNANRAKLSRILQDLRIVQHSVVVKAGNVGASEFGTIGAPFFL